MFMTLVRATGLMPAALRLPFTPLVPTQPKTTSVLAADCAMLLIRQSPTPCGASALFGKPLRSVKASRKAG
jgi:hypothetical protein